jgi:hypothetical protein
MNKPTSRGLKAAAASLVLSIAFVAALVVPATGFAADEPLLSFSPAPVGFAKTTVGTESQSQAVDVHNVSGADVAVDQVAIEGADSGDFKITAGGCGWLGIDHHCSLSVAFAPGSAGAKTATLSLKPKETPEQTVQLEGEAVPAQLAFTPDGYDFGIQRVSRAEGSANFQLANVGEARTQLGGLGIGGPDHDNFWTNGGNCSPGYWLQPGESCNVQVGFNPWDTVAYEAELQAHVNGATFTASLTGFGGRAVVETTPNPVDFGALPVGSVGPITPIVVSNNGNVATSFFIAVIAGGSVASFQLIDEDCTGAPLDPGASCTAYVRFTPQVTGPKAARLALFGDEEGGTMVMLTGEGTAPASPVSPPAAALPPSASPAPAAPPRGRHRRFERSAGLFAGQARCHAAKCRKALRPRRVAATG